MSSFIRVSKMAVIGLPDHKWMEIVEAVAVTKKGMTQLYLT